MPYVVPRDYWVKFDGTNNSEIEALVTVSDYVLDTSTPEIIRWVTEWVDVPECTVNAGEWTQINAGTPRTRGLSDAEFKARYLNASTLTEFTS